MSLASWLTLARDLTGVLAAGAAFLTAAVFWSGAVGAFGGLAASFAVIALGGVAGIALGGLLGGVLGLPGGAVSAIVAAVLLAGVFYGAHAFGVRGLWVALLATLGVGFAWAMLWAFSGRLAAGLPALAPALAFLVLSLLAFGALAAAARSAAVQETVSASQGRSEPLMSAARRMLATPPAWFDCAYATLGGEATRPGECAFTPPEVASNPQWIAPAAAPRADGAVGSAGLDSATLASGGEAGIAEPSSPEAAPASPIAPAAPSLENPVFDTAVEPAATPAADPDRIIAPRNPDRAPAAHEQAAHEQAAASGGEAPAAGDRDDAAEGPEAAFTPEGLAEPQIAAAPAAPRPPRADPGATPSSPSPPAAVASPAETRADGGADARAAPERSAAELNTLRTAFVCFPMTSLAADRLCPDQRFDVGDLGVRWRMPGGEAVDAPAGVDCSVDPETGLHATLLINLSGDLAAQLTPVSAGGGAVRTRKAEILYEAATRMLGAARGQAEKGAAAQLSLYVAGGSSLLSPWAEQSFGPDRTDRLFDLASSGQALTLLRRLKADTQALRKDQAREDLAATLQAMREQRPQSGLERAQSVVILVTDALATAAFDEETAGRIGAAFAEEALAILSIEIGPGGASPAMTRLAEASGGSAFAAADGEALYQQMRRAFDRARRFCAVRVTAPERFFQEGEIELRLRRRASDGCALEQIATLSCEGLRLDERIDPNAE